MFFKNNVFYHYFSTVSFSVKIERPWESFPKLFLLSWIFQSIKKKMYTIYEVLSNKPKRYQRDKIRISIVFRKKNKSKKSTVGFSVEIERPWESFISKISSLTLCSMTISSYVLFISPPIYIEGRLRQGCSLKTCGRAGSRQEDNTLGRCGNIERSHNRFMGRGEIKRMLS